MKIAIFKIHKGELITDNYATSAAELELTKTRFGKMFSIVFCSATVLKSLIVLTKTDETFVRKTVCVCLFVFLLRHYYYILLNADLIFFFFYATYYVKIRLFVLTHEKNALNSLSNFETCLNSNR